MPKLVFDANLSPNRGWDLGMPFLSCGGVFGDLTLLADVQSYDTSQPVQKRPRTPHPAPFTLGQ